MFPSSSSIMLTLQMTSASLLSDNTVLLNVVYVKPHAVTYVKQQDMRAAYRVCSDVSQTSKAISGTSSIHSDVSPCRVGRRVLSPLASIRILSTTVMQLRTA